MPNRNVVTGIIAAVLMFLTAAPLLAQDAPRAGGVLKAAMIGEPPSLDIHWTTAVIIQQITWHIYEGLYTYDSQFNPIPMLAEGHAVADGGGDTPSRSAAASSSTTARR